MALTGLDLTRATRTLAERLALVEEVANAPAHEQETSWIEWKSTLDLLDTAVQFQIARHVLGFANRHPDAASSDLGGCAYLLVGVEPGDVQGVNPIDAAQLDKAVNRYTGGTAGPRWSPDYVQCRGYTVLVITVEPPVWGDPIHTLKHGFDKSQPGMILIRRHGETEQANAQEAAMLSERLTRGTPQVEIGLRWVANKTPEIPAVGITDESVDQWAERERVELLRHLDEYQPELTTAAAAAMASALTRNIFGEKRTAAEYRDEVDGYIARARKAMFARVFAAAVGRSMPVGVALTNATDRNFSEVRCELKIGGPVRAVFDTEREARDLGKQFPARPRPYGAPPKDPFGLSGIAAAAAYTRAFTPPRLYRGYINNSASALVRFDPENLRPRDDVPLEPFVVIAGAPLAGKTLEVHWKATATNADGVASGSLTLTVAPEVIGIESLTERRTPAAPADDDPD